MSDAGEVVDVSDAGAVVDVSDAGAVVDVSDAGGVVDSGVSEAAVLGASDRAETFLPRAPVLAGSSAIASPCSKLKRY